MADTRSVTMPDGMVIEDVPTSVSTEKVIQQYQSTLSKNAMPGSPAPPNPPQMKTMPGPGLVRGASEMLPWIGASAGTAVGAPVGGIGGVAGGTAGGGLGGIADSLIREKVLGDKPGSTGGAASGALKGAATAALPMLGRWATATGPAVEKAPAAAEAAAPKALPAHEATQVEIDQALKKKILELQEKVPSFKKSTLGKDLVSWAGNRDPLTGRIVSPHVASEKLIELMGKKEVQKQVMRWAGRMVK